MLSWIMLTQVEPIRLSTGQPEPAPSVLPLWIGLVFVGVAILVTLAAWAWSIYCAKVEANPTEYAFAAMAKRLGISGGQQELLRRLAAGARTAPVALLLSDHALEVAAMCFEREHPRSRDVERVQRLCSSLTQ